MKFLKWFLFILMAIVGIYMLMCVLGPKNLNTTRSTTIKAAPAMVFNQINDLKKWETWSPWNDMDSSMVIKYGAKYEGKGGQYTWKGDPSLTGSGDMLITESIKNEKTAVTMNFHDYETTSFVEFNLKPDGDEVDVEWKMEDKEDLPFIMRGMMLVLGQKSTLKKNFDDGLAALKSSAEKRAKGEYDGFMIKPVEVKEKHFIMNRQEVAMENISQFYATNLGSLFGKVQKNGIEMSGKPCGLFFKWDEANGKTDMAAAIPVAEKLWIADASSLDLPEANTLQIDFYGDFSGTAKAHYAMEDYLKDHGLFNNPPIIEEYLTDPAEEPDPSKWLTKIIYYVSK